MIVVQSFALLNLPLLPLEEVISHMRLVDQMLFSMVSRKTRNLVKKQNTICHLQLSETISQDWSSIYKIECKNQDGSESFKIDIFGMNHQDKDFLYQRVYGIDAPFKIRKDSLTTFWGKPLKGLWKMTSVLCNAFKTKSFFISSHVYNREKLQSIAENIQKLEFEFKVNVSKIKISGVSLGAGTYKYIVENFKDVPELVVNSCDTIYRHSNVQPENSYCEINNATSLTSRYMDLLKKYESIKVYHLNLTSQEINIFLKEWMESTKMKNVELTTKNVNIELAIKGLPVTPQQKLISFGKISRLNAMCYEVRRNDGVKAHFWDNFGSFAMQTFE